MNDDKILDISWGAIFKISIALLCFYLIYLVRDVLIWFIFAIIISVLFESAIAFLQKLKIPRILSVIFIYVAIFGILGSVVYLSAPMFISEIQQFSQLFPQHFEKIAPSLRSLGFEAFENIESFTRAMENTLQKASSDILSTLAVFFGGISSAIFILVMAFFLSLEEGGVEKVIGIFFPKRYEIYILFLWKKSQAKVSGWFASRILMAAFVGLASLVVFYLFNVKYALSLAFLSAILDFIPFLGPIIIGIIAFIFVVLDSWLKAIFVLIAFILIQQVENNILSPILTKKFVGLPPILVILFLTIGGKLLGILGAVLIVPLAGILYEFLRDFLKKKRETEAQIL